MESILSMFKVSSNRSTITWYLFMFLFQIKVEFKSTFPGIVLILFSKKWCFWCSNKYFSGAYSWSWFYTHYSICWRSNAYSLLLNSSWCSGVWMAWSTKTYQFICEIDHTNYFISTDFIVLVHIHFIKILFEYVLNLIFNLQLGNSC